MAELPVYQMLIDENVNSEFQVDFVSLVDSPAVKKNFIAFAKSRQTFALDEDRYIISGIAMLANTPIYRNDVQYGEYEVVFTPDVILKIVQKFFEKGFQHNINLFHDLPATGITIFESFIVDSKRGIKPMQGFEDVPDGSWFISAKVDNPDVWQKIKSGVFKGFSVEGIFKYRKEKMSDKQIAKKLIELIDEFLNDEK